MPCGSFYSLIILEAFQSKCWWKVILHRTFLSCAIFVKYSNAEIMQVILLGDIYMMGRNVTDASETLNILWIACIVPDQPVPGIFAETNCQRRLSLHVVAVGTESSRNVTVAIFLMSLSSTLRLWIEGWILIFGVITEIIPVPWKVIVVICC